MMKIATYNIPAAHNASAIEKGAAELSVPRKSRAGRENSSTAFSAISGEREKSQYSAANASGTIAIVTYLERKLLFFMLHLLYRGIIAHIQQEKQHKRLKNVKSVIK